MLTFEDEDDLLKDIREGVSIALDEYPGEGEVDDIKFNKLAYFAIQNYNLDITYGWYKYGPAPDFANLGGAVTTVDPTPQQEVQAAATSRIPTINNEYLSPEEYRYYFLEDIRTEFEQIVTTDTKEYLVGFYDEYAPPVYRELYKESAQLQQSLDYIRDNEEWFSESGVYYDEIENGLNNVYRELLQLPNLSESATPYQRYSRLLRDVLIAADSQDELSPEQQQFIGKVIDFFYGAIWEYVALLISKDTVVGENKRELKKSIEDDLQSLRERYNREIESLRTRAEAFNLIPEAVEERQELIEERQELPPIEDSIQIVDAWTSMGAEVIMDDDSP